MTTILLSSACGELPDGFDCKAAAAFYATLQHGMSILARDGADAATLNAVARTGVEALAPMKSQASKIVHGATALI